MNSFKWSLTVLAVAVLGAVAGYRWANHGQPVATAPATPSQASRRILYYRDPMKPEVRFEKPGKSPYMDMPLVPVYADEAAGTNSVAVSAAAQQRLGLRIGHVAKSALAPRVSAVGSVAYDEHAVAVLQSRVAGYVTRLPVRAVQDRVHRGQVMAEVTAPAWIQAEGEYLALLLSASASGSRLLEPARRRLSVLGVPESAIIALEASHAVPTSLALYAPIDGVVTELGLREGASFEAGALLFRINGTASVWVNAQLSEFEAGAVTAGQKVETVAAGLPGEVFAGRVQAVLPEVNATTRTVGVRVVVDNTAGRLRPGMFVQSTFTSSPAAPRLWVPSEAVIATGTRSVVIVKRGDNAFDVVNVTLGQESDGKTVILSGLAEGQSIVLSGQFLIDSEAGLKSAINRLTTPAAPAAGSAP
jgi:membrane fusion protein, copper/silver efflux system